MPATFFMPRFVYNAVTLDFDVPAALVQPGPTPIAGGNLAYNGQAEWLFNRVEHTLLLSFENLTTTMLASVYTWWSTWACKGKQTAITLDRAATCAGQWEYDQFNAFFTKAELIASPFQMTIPPLGAQKFVLARARYRDSFLFRQGV